MVEITSSPDALAAIEARSESGRELIDEAMERYANGEDAAFGDLYDLLAPRLMGYLRRIVRDATQVEDFAQATLLQMHRARGTFIRGASVLPWAFAIARRLVIDDFRRRKHAPPIALDDEALGEIVSPQSSPHARAEASELATLIERTLAAMPEPQRVAFKLLKMEGLSVAEAAALLLTTEMSVKLRAHRAYEMLREAIDRRFGRG